MVDVCHYDNDFHKNRRNDDYLTDADFMTEDVYSSPFYVPWVYFGSYPMAPYLAGSHGIESRPDYHFTDVFNTYSADQLYEWSRGRIPKKLESRCICMTPCSTSRKTSRGITPSNYYFLTKKFDYLYALFHCKDRSEFLTRLRERDGDFGGDFVFEFMHTLFSTEYDRKQLVPPQYWTFTEDELKFVLELVKIYADFINSQKSDFFDTHFYELCIDILSFSMSKNHPYGKEISDVMVKHLSDECLKRYADQTHDPVFTNEIKRRNA